MFVRKKDFSSILHTAKASINKHENYIEFLGEQEETWLNYNFHLNGDEKRKVKLAVLLFNLQESK